VSDMAKQGPVVVTSADGGNAVQSGIQQSRRRWQVLAVLCVGLFMLLLDGTIVNIAIPSILKSFQTGFSQVEWVMNAYLLVFAVMLITMGRLGDLYGRKKLFIAGLSLFTLASLACGLSPNIGFLIGFRALQGLGGAMMMPATLSIIAYVFPPKERGIAMGIWGGVSGLATAAGPTLGGLIVDATSWHYIFLINVPIGIVLFFFALRIIPDSRDSTAPQKVDFPGVVVLSIALFSLTFALIEGQKYGWGSATILALFAAAAVGILVFILIERTVKHPLMQLSLFRSRTFSAANVGGMILSFGMMGMFFLLPVFFQAILGYSAVKTGLVMTPMSAAVVVAAPLSGWLSDRIGSRWLIFSGMLITAFGFFLMRGQMSLDTQWTSLVFPFVVSGFGIGLVMAPMTSAVMSTAPQEKAGAASGILSTMRQLGSVMGIAVMGAVLQNRAVAYVEGSVAGKLAGVPFVPDAAKQQIIKAVGSSVTNMGDMAFGGGGAPQMPAAIKDLLAQVPANMVQQVTDFFKDLFSRATIMGDYVQAMRTTFIVAIVVLLVGSLVALLIRSHVAKKVVVVDEGPAEEAGLAIAEACEPLVEGDLLQEDRQEHCKKPDGAA
jgi:EmrB/QacA subfamily drug resistance transporter